MRQELALAYQLAAAKGWGDGIYTHISACVPGEAGSYLINRFGLNFEDVNAENLVKVNLKGEILSGVGQTRKTVRAIHLVSQYMEQYMQLDLMYLASCICM